MICLGYDIGSSSVKASLLDVESGTCLASASSPACEAPIQAPKPGWAEQHPEDWWCYLKEATRALLARCGPIDIAAIGISYQMHGLVCVDRDNKPLRPAIIWCDGRAVPYGEKAFLKMGAGYCLERMLNSPGNFTAAKLAWVKENEPDVYARTRRILLPGDWMAARMTGEAFTTVSGLSECILWDFVAGTYSRDVMDALDLDPSMLAPLSPTFGEQGRLLPGPAAELGLQPGIPITYRAGDQPNNAFSLGVMHPGQVAATAGTSGVVYGVSDRLGYDPQSRVNTFAHVNHSPGTPRLGVLLCLNGAGILNAWMRRNTADAGLGYEEMNAQAARIPAGSDGVSVLPFGNGAERLLKNRAPGCDIRGIDFNRHTRAHLWRAAQEGIAFAFRYGIDILSGIGMPVKTIHAGNANMFLSPVFRESLASVTGATIKLYDTDGAEGAARGAAVGAGFFSTPDEAFSTLRQMDTVFPSTDAAPWQDAYKQWTKYL